MWDKIKQIPRMEIFHNRTFYKMVSITVLIAGICVCLYAGFREEDVVAVGNMYGDRKLPIYCVETEEKVVALSFDAAWGNEDTQEILDILERQDIKVTFFMTGGWVEAYPEDVKKIYLELIT